MTGFLKFEEITTGIALRAAMFFLLVATGLCVYQVTTRFFFGHPSTWTEVITRAAMIWGVFLGVAPAIREGAMISVEVLQNNLPRKMGIALHTVASLLTLLFFCILLWQGYEMIGKVANQRMAALDISMAWAYAALPVGSAFIIIATIGSSIRALNGGWDERPEVLQ